MPTGCVARRGEVDARPDGDEEESQQQTLEGLEVALELVAVFAVGEDHAADERAERRGQLDHAHQHGDAHDDEEGGPP